MVFRPKNSVPAIAEEHETLLYRYIWGFIRNKGCWLYRIGGMPDHIHILLQLPTTLALADFMRGLKTATNKYMSLHRDCFPLFEGWGKSYCAITCSYIDKDKVIDYIARQKEHHRVVDFKEELNDIFQVNHIYDSVDNFLGER